MWLCTSIWVDFLIALLLLLLLLLPLPLPLPLPSPLLQTADGPDDSVGSMGFTPAGVYL
jgi:hypothetical protein